MSRVSPAYEDGKTVTACRKAIDPGHGIRYLEIRAGTDRSELIPGGCA